MTTETQARARRAWWVGVVCGMASYIDAAALIGFGTAIVILQGVLGLTVVELGIASGSLTLGVAIGALVGGRLGDKFGRRPIFIGTMIMILLGSVGIMLAPGFALLLVAVLLLGLGAGADLPVSLSTISEAADDTNRGKLIAFSNLLWIVGVVLTMVIGGIAGSLGQLGVTIIFGHVALVTLIVLACRLTIPESTSWQAAELERTSNVETVRADRSSIRDLLRTPYVIPFLALIGFYALTNLTANTAGQYNVFLLVNYADVPIEQATLLGLPGLPVSILLFVWFMRVADKPYRFRYFTVGAVCMVAAPLVYVFFGVSVPTFFVNAAFSTVGAAFAFEGIMKIWTQISFPTLLRTTAQGTIIAVARFAAAGLAGVTPLLLSFGPGPFYSVLAGLSFIGLTWAWFVFRTRDRHSEFDTEAQDDDNPHPATATSADTTPPTSTDFATR